MGKKDVRSVFEKSWTNSFVSGLLLYAERSQKKIFMQNLMKQVSNFTENDFFIAIYDSSILGKCYTCMYMSIPEQKPTN